MKFYGKPHAIVADKDTKKPIVIFDSNGECEISDKDKKLITRMKKHFSIEKPEEKG